MNRLILFIPFALFLVLVGYFAVGLTRDPSKLPSVLIDQPAPAFDLPPLLDGGQGLATADLKGQVQLVNVFASWCAPCRIEHPVLMRLAKEEGITIHGIAYKDKPEDSRRFLGMLGNPYGRIGLDLEGRAGIEWGITGVPETFIIDKDGRIRWRYQGPLGPTIVEGELMPMLRELSK
ncbi:MAG: hypothetical protein RLY86_2156 [Pseudomonadota bacterium]|jgi:cytochrome c biogenesis protein CcmG/thiol:disulfide interchange protein DsbE